ncbi:hypothetical protein HAZT_HAZT001736 [Hyalella azteca]|uniref:Uncharacterized protein n=1 Tax=Hyalella azteca TaxID=294128 RepID=A0A6A0H7B3_HYAAZ|nr:hypothetical protein HAZT_HAZT001736 [Hyalella azteca]
MQGFQCYIRHSPFCEDTYYSKRDESDDSTDTSRIHRKFEVVTETHTKVMSSKKSEITRKSSRSPAREPRSSTNKPNEGSRRDVNVVDKRMPSPKDLTVVRDTGSTSEPRIIQEPVKYIPKIDAKLKSTQLVREVQIDVGIPDLPPEAFSYQIEAPKERKPQAAPPPTPKKFVPGEFRESDYESATEDRVRPKWAPPSDQEVKESTYTKVEPSLHHREPMPKVRTPTPPSQFDVAPPRFEGPPRPKIEFPDSESEAEKHQLPIVSSQPKMKKGLSKISVKPEQESPLSSFSSLQKEMSPELQPEPVAVEGYIPPAPPPISYHTDTLGVESTKITTISDTSKFHRRFITQQHTTRVFKLSDMTVAAPTMQQAAADSETGMTHQVDVKISPMAVDAPPPEALPFTPFSRRERKKERVVPLSKPSKFRKGEFRESEYESEDDTKIRSKWQPPDSDADEPSYNKVRPPPSSHKSHSRSRERSPTPPSGFEIPPKTGEPLRPVVEIAVNKSTRTPTSDIQTKKAASSPKHAPDRHMEVTEHPPIPPSDHAGKLSFVSKVEVESRHAPPMTKEVPIFEARPYTEIIEKTEKIFTKKNIIQEVKQHHTRKETTTTTVQKPQAEKPVTTVNGFQSTKPPTEEQLELHPPEKRSIFPSKELHEVEVCLEEFPFKPSPPRPKRARGSLPPTPKVFVKREFSESDYDSEYDGKIKPKWNPSDSDADDLRYKKVVAPKFSKPVKMADRERTPTPPSKFDVPPVQGGPLRPGIKMHERVVLSSLGSTDYPIADKTILDSKPDLVNLEPGPPPVVGYIGPERNASLRKNTYVVEENFRVTMEKSEDEYCTLTESDYTDSEVSRLAPLPMKQVCDESANVKQSQPSLPVRESVFLKGALPASPGSLRKDRQIWPPKTGQIKSDVTHTSGDKPPVPSHTKPGLRAQPKQLFEPSFLNDRERRESLEDYSVAKFPHVEFKPYEGILAPAVNGTPQPTTAPSSAKKYVDQQLGDLTHSFRVKAQNLTEKLVGEVLCAKEDIESAKSAKNLQSRPGELDSSEPQDALTEPQVYRDESRASEFGTKHIDPDSGLIYFKYDFGYEFGILLPGQGQQVDKETASKDSEGSVPFPILHTKTPQTQKDSRNASASKGSFNFLPIAGFALTAA